MCAPFKTLSDSDTGNIDEEVLRELNADEDGLNIGEASEEADVEDEADDDRENARVLRGKNGLLGAGSIHARKRKSTKREVMKVRAGELYYIHMYDCVCRYVSYKVQDCGSWVYLADVLVCTCACF